MTTEATSTVETTGPVLGARLIELQDRHRALTTEGDALQAEIDVLRKRQDELEAESIEVLAEIQDMAFGDLRRAIWSFMR